MPRKKSWPYLTSGLKAARRREKANEARIPAGLLLPELRRARGISQQALAETLGARQPSVSKLERQDDMHVSTLRKYIAALGGELEITARFPGGAVHRLRCTP